jgi:uncharacterized DUF497 family protein
MDFEWDEVKREQNLTKHGVDLLVAALIFEGPTLSMQDHRHDYGEIRQRSIGMVDGICYVVVHTTRNDAVRLISAWQGGRRDRRKFEESISR